MKYILIAFLTVVILGVLQAFRSKSKNRLIKESDLVELGELLFPSISLEFETFFNSYINTRDSFLTENKDLLEEYDNFELEKLKAIEVIYIFGDYKNKLWMTDWRGEENTKEIEQFLESALDIKCEWNQVKRLRFKADEKEYEDGEFVISLLKAIDTDLEQINKKLIFLNLGWDSYVYTAVDQASVKIITEKYGSLFHQAENLLL